METLLQSDTMHLEKEGKRAWVTFTRASHLNAMNNEGTVLLTRVALAIREDPDIRVVVIRGRGRAFCTGIDLKQLSSDEIDMSYFERWEKALRIFEQMEKIVIVGMHGYCLGGGLQLALACDIRVSTPGCQIGLPANLYQSFVSSAPVEAFSMIRIAANSAKTAVLSESSRTEGAVNSTAIANQMARIQIDGNDRFRRPSLNRLCTVPRGLKTELLPKVG